MPDSRLHGPEQCPRVCSVCHGEHHWIDCGFDPDDPFDPEDPQTQAVIAYDREHGTEHCLAHFGCKHCSAWAEAEYVWELEEESELDL